MRKALHVLTLTLGIVSMAFSSDRSPEALNVYYFGNSLTGNSMWSLHPDLGSTAGKTWKTGASVGAGWTLFQHWYDQIEKPRTLGQPGKAAETMRKDNLDVIVLQVFGKTKLEEVVSEKFGGKIKFDKPTDVGDIRSATDLSKLFLEINPSGIVYIYSDWPPVARMLGPDGKPLKEKGVGDGAGYDVVPDRDSFDFGKLWDIKLGEADSSLQSATAFRAYDEAVLAGVAKNLPELASSGRLRMIPVGEVLYVLDKKIKAGEAPAGFPRIADFYTDTIHFRSGLPRYAVAATFFATLFQEEPAKLDWNLFNDPSNYKSKKFTATLGTKLPVYVHEDDLGEHLAITPEHAAFLNSTIWEVVHKHPHTKISSTDSSAPKG